jgi:hypothetical protein
MIARIDDSMDLPRLAIPHQAPNTRVAAFFNAAKLKTWLEALPLGNPAKTAQDLLAALQQVNQTEAPVHQRFYFLEQCRPLIADLMETLHKQYATAAIPLADKSLAAAELAHSLLNEMAYGYKAVLLATSDAPANETTRNMLIASALYAMHHLARLLVDIYSLYGPPPKALWLELHQIYRYAEKQGFLAVSLPQQGKGSGIRSIDHTYRRIIMLALANPYRLMQGEVLQVFRELDKWANNCRILPLAVGTTPNGNLYLDLDKDEAPCYAPINKRMQPPGDGRILEISGVLAALEQRTKELVNASKSESGQLDLAGRKLRNMYKRLADAWGIRIERLSDRKPRSIPVEIAVGISVAHHFAGNGAPFTPETSELELRKGKLGKKGQELSLLGENDTPWVNEQQGQRLSTGIVQPRTSQFESEAAKGKDIWVKIYSTQAHFEHQQKGNASPTIESTHCQLRDESRGGMAISCKRGHGVRLIPGEVIAFKSEHAPTADDWSVGVVRWLRTTAQEKLELGIGLLADDTLPVATRGVKGVGKDSEYFRSLLIPKLDPTQYPTTLLTPATVYDVDSVIFVNTGTQLFYAQLTRLVDATNAFSQFQFQIVDAP